MKTMAKPSKGAPRKPAIAVDFDGVLHSYSSPWQGATVIPDPPVEGAIQWLERMVEHFTVFIFSTRCKEISGPPAMLNWFKEYGLPEGVRRQLYFEAEKPPALIYLDDRAMTFTGTFPTIDEINVFRPWNKKSP
jgi:hypothetical protein